MAAVLFFTALLLSSCRREEEALLIDDQEISGSSETGLPDGQEDGQEAGESEGTSSQDDRSDRIVPVPKDLASDRTVLGFSYSPDYYHNEEHSFAADGDSLYYVRSRNMPMTEENDYAAKGSFLYCADRITGNSRVCCSLEGCEHNTGNCGAYMCSFRDIQAMMVDDGVLWYIWSRGSFDDTEFHIACIDLENERRYTPWKIELNLIADPDGSESMPMHTACIFFNGYVIALQSSALWNRAAFGELQGTRGYTDHALISAWKLPDQMNTSVTETVLPLSDEILDEKYPDMYRQRVYMQPYGEDLYILQSGETPGDLKEPAESWNMRYGFSVRRWHAGAEEPELLAESDEYSAWNYYVTDEGILLLEFDSMEETALVRVNAEKKTEDVLASGDEWWLGEAKFAADRIVSFEDEDAGFGLMKTKNQVCRVYDLSGKLLTECIKDVTDPRIADPDMAGDMYSIRYTADNEGVYMGWKEGIMYYPFAEGEPVRYFGYTTQ